jgi:ABC-type Na+ efflux pump permease subunit
MVVKEFRQLRRDRRTLAMMVVLLMLMVFGYAAVLTSPVSRLAWSVRAL